MASRGWENVKPSDLQKAMAGRTSTGHSVTTKPRRRAPDASAILTTGRFDITVPRELKSPNTWQGRHWRFKHHDSQDWEWHIWTAIARALHVKDLTGALLVQNAIPPKRRCEARRRVTVTRFVPSPRNFIQDDDNLRFSTKPLNDALKRLGLIRDDNRKWLDQPTPEQAVTDGDYSTRIQIEEV